MQPTEPGEQGPRSTNTRRGRRRRRLIAGAAVLTVGAVAVVAGAQLIDTGGRAGTVTGVVEQVTDELVKDGEPQLIQYPFAVARHPSGEALITSLTEQKVFVGMPLKSSTSAMTLAMVEAESRGKVAQLIAGNGTRGSWDGPAADASFGDPCGVAVDSSGRIFVADAFTNRIRMIAAGKVTTVAGGSGTSLVDGSGSKAQFHQPCGLAFDAAGNLYVADTLNHAIRKMTPAGAVSTLAGNGTAGYADGTGTAARFTAPWGLAVDSRGNVYVADSGNHRIRRITPAGAVSTLAGNGTAGYADGAGTAARFSNPSGVAVRSSDGTVFVADTDNHRIRRIAANGAVTTLAGSGEAGHRNVAGESLTNARFSSPYGIALETDTVLYVADTFNSRIRQVVFNG